jgi:hypothetical protein
MSNGGQSGSGGRRSRGVKLARLVWVSAGVALCLFGVARDLFGLAPGDEMRLLLAAMILVWIGITLGIVLVQTARSLVLRRPPDNGPGA